MGNLSEVQKLFGSDDPLFPPLKLNPVNGALQVTGFQRQIY